MRVVLARVGSLLGALAAAVAVFVLAARLELGFWPQAILALAAFVVAGWFLLRVADRSRPNERRATWPWLAGGAVAYAILAQLLVGSAPARTLVAPQPTAETKFWTLVNGRRIAYERVVAKGTASAAPVIVLHDGPGMPALPFYHALSTRPFDFLSEAGFDVYYYDQFGAGLSGRLDLRTEKPYSVSSAVADLEAIREMLKVPTMILAGTGWGSTLATNYLLQYPQHVAKLILESPGPIWAPAWPDLIAPSARANMTDVQASALAALQRPPLRLVLGRMMADFSSRSAHTFIADWEGDEWWTQTISESVKLGQPNMTCHSDPGQGIPAPSGLGFFAYSYTQADAARLPDPRPALGKLTTETLIIRGTCDYTNWPVSAEYLKVLRGSHYVAIPAAGHFIWLEQGSLWREVVGAFMRGETLPLEVYNPG